jgi:hypothetical protein
MGQFFPVFTGVVVCSPFKSGGNNDETFGVYFHAFSS